MNLSERLKKARENASLSQQDVADSLNISRKSVSKCERGISYPDIENLVILSDLYNISIDFLLKDNNETLVEETSKEIIQKNAEDKNENFQNTYKSFAIVATTLLSCMVPLIGIILNLGIIVFCIIKKEKLPSWVWMILIVCLFINFVNALIVLDGYFFKYGRATIEKVALF